MPDVDAIPNELLTMPAYTVSEAAKLAGTTAPTVRRWFWGNEITPVFGERTSRTEPPTDISFLMLAEVVVAVKFRRSGVKLDTIRRAHQFARKHFAVEHPFAFKEFEVPGGHVMYEFSLASGEPPLYRAVDTEGMQAALPMEVLRRIRQFDFVPASAFAARWFPLGRDVPIVVDPRFAAGRPSVEGRGIRAETVLRRFFQGGESIEALSEDFELDPYVIEDIIRNMQTLAA